MSDIDTDILPLPRPDGTPDWQLTDPGTMEGEWIEGLTGIEGAVVQLRFAYGSGSGGVTALVQSSLDDGTTAYDVAMVSFAAATRTVVVNLRPAASALVEPGEGGVAADGSAEAEGVLLAALGPMLRLKVIQAGTYQNTVLSGRVMPI